VAYEQQVGAVGQTLAGKLPEGVPQPTGAVQAAEQTSVPEWLWHWVASGLPCGQGRGDGNLRWGDVLQQEAAGQVDSDVRAPPLLLLLLISDEWPSQDEIWQREGGVVVGEQPQRRVVGAERQRVEAAFEGVPLSFWVPMMDASGT
jgi:hypothetical protein